MITAGLPARNHDGTTTRRHDAAPLAGASRAGSTGNCESRCIRDHDWPAASTKGHEDHEDNEKTLVSHAAATEWWRAALRAAAGVPIREITSRTEVFPCL